MNQLSENPYINDQIKIVQSWTTEQSVNILKDALEILDNFVINTRFTFDCIYPYPKVKSWRDERVSGLYAEEIDTLLTSDNFYDIYACDDKGNMLIYTSISDGCFKVISVKTAMLIIEI
jgi:hypothetical protein